MGTTNSKNNDDMVDNLVNSGSIRDKQIEQAFRLVDRGRFFPPEYIREAYREQPFKVPEIVTSWAPGRLHISAPSMYAAVLENLQFRTGMSFLNIGSGSGWLSTAVGFIIGSKGINHGIEIHENLYRYSKARLRETLDCPQIAPFSFAVPKFIHGNGLSQKIPDGMPRYDRIYCGAALSSHKSVDRLVRMLEIRGRLIAPVNGGLMCYHRTGIKRYTAQRLMSCQFAELIRSTKTDKRDLLPIIHKPDTLQRLCRSYIRNKIRKELWGKIPPKMRNTSSKERDNNYSTGPHVVYIHNFENNEGRLNIMEGLPPAGGNVARVRVMMPNAEDPHWAQQHGEDIIVHHDNEDNTRLQVHDLKDEDEDEDDEPIPPPVERLNRQAIIRRLRGEDVNQMEEEAVFVINPQIGQVVHHHVRRRTIEPEDMSSDEDNDNDDDDEDDEQVGPHVVFPDEGPNVVESDEDEPEANRHNPDEASASDADQNSDESMREGEEVARPNRPPPPEELPEDMEIRDINEVRGHRVLTRQRMQVIESRRRRRDQDSEGDSEDGQESKRHKVEETKDEKQIRIQQETISHFRDIFNMRLDTLPVPNHINEYLKHSNGRI